MWTKTKTLIASAGLITLLALGGTATAEGPEGPGGEPGGDSPGVAAATLRTHESMFERTSRLANNEIYLGRQVPLARSTAEIESITMSEVRAAAESLLDPAAFSLVTIGPESSRRPSLKDLDF